MTDLSVINSLMVLGPKVDRNYSVMQILLWLLTALLGSLSIYLYRNLQNFNGSHALMLVNKIYQSFLNSPSLPVVCLISLPLFC